MPENLFVENTYIAIALALLFVGLLLWRVKQAQFRSISRGSFALAAGLFWGSLAAILIVYAWEFFYQLFVPSWYRIAAPVGAVVLYPVLALLIRWAALRLPGNPVLWFCLLGGLESIPEHAVAIYRFDILQIPILQGSTAASIFIFAYFEYVLYWSAVLALAVLVERLQRTLKMQAFHA